MSPSVLERLKCVHERFQSASNLIKNMTENTDELPGINKSNLRQQDRK